MVYHLEINNCTLFFVDDEAIAKNREDLKMMMRKLKDYYKEGSMRINNNKKQLIEEEEEEDLFV